MIKLLNSSDWEPVATSVEISHGLGLFETLLMIGPRPVFLEEHLIRLNQSMTFFGVKARVTPAMIYPLILEKLMEISGDGDETNIRRVLKIVFYIVDTIGYLDIRVHADPYANFDWQGGAVVTISSAMQPTTNVLNHHKTFNYLERRLLLKEAAGAGADEILRFNEFSELVEGAKTNVFLFDGETWFTPALSCGALNGIARKWLIEQLGLAGYNVIEAKLSHGHVKGAQLIVLTNSLMGCVMARLQGDDSRVQITHHSANAQSRALNIINQLHQAYRGGYYGTI